MFSQISPSANNVKWFVEEMPVIEEEEERLHRKTPRNLSASLCASLASAYIFS